MGGQKTAATIKVFRFLDGFVFANVTITNHSTQAHFNFATAPKDMRHAAPSSQLCHPTLSLL
jgi:hypothetical protein